MEGPSRGNIYLRYVGKSETGEDEREGLHDEIRV